jgi:radical SAM family uncharacterized protein/radical SAM-linked protein
MSERPELTGILSRVEKPGRYVGGEWNEIRKRPAARRTKVGLAFPDVYEIGMSYLGQKILYSLLNRDRDICAERVFAPWPDLERELRSAGLPLTTLENGLPLRDLDILGFSLLYELNDSNILTILDLGGIPLLSSERGEGHPLVIAGGPAAFNPEPLAGFFDLFLIGDGEEAFPEIVRSFRKLKGSGLDRTALLRELSGIEGVYVPALYQAVRHAASPLAVPEPREGAPARIRKRILRDFRRAPFPEKIVVPSLRVIFDRVAVEAARGCPQNCRFCQAASVYFPPRVKDPALVHRTVVRSLRQTGYEDASLSALSIGDYPYLEGTVRCLMDELSRDKISLSLSSLRPGKLSRDLVENIQRVRKTGFTLVPEAGTERLRRVINKKLDDREIEDALTFAFQGGWKLIKLYFMVGLPTETDEDLSAVVSLVRRALDLGRSILGSLPRIHVSLASFIPKPHTPFQWLGMEDEDRLLEKQDIIRGELRRHRSVEVKAHPTDTSVLEAVFSRGDRRLGPVLARAWSKGARFDGWGDRLEPDLWRRAFDEEGVDLRDYLGPLGLDAVLPWDHVDAGLTKAHLRRELERALRGEPSPSCLERPCAECGGCDLRFWKKPERPATIVGLPEGATPLGEPSDGMWRYRAVYSKRRRARYLSHIDLIHVLQRGFRRARIEVRKTEGFHPKMDLSYGPALPLGMEGLREVLEFRSPRIMEEADFLARINKALPEGIRFRSLTRLDRSAPSLHDAIVKLVYSFEPGDRKPADLIRLLESAKGAAPEATSLEFEVRRRRAYLRLDPPGRGLRPQDVVREVLGIDDPVFLLRRDEVVLRAGPN